MLIVGMENEFVGSLERGKAKRDKFYLADSFWQTPVTISF